MTTRLWVWCLNSISQMLLPFISSMGSFIPCIYSRKDIKLMVYHNCHTMPNREDCILIENYGSGKPRPTRKIHTSYLGNCKCPELNNGIRLSCFVNDDAAVYHRIYFYKYFPVNFMLPNEESSTASFQSCDLPMNLTHLICIIVIPQVFYYFSSHHFDVTYCNMTRVKIRVFPRTLLFQSLLSYCHSMWHPAWQVLIFEFFKYIAWLVAPSEHGN